MIMLTFPKLKQESGSVLNGLRLADADDKVVGLWQEILKLEIEADEDDY